MGRTQTLQGKRPTGTITTVTHEFEATAEGVRDKSPVWVSPMFHPVLPVDGLLLAATSSGARKGGSAWRSSRDHD